MTDPKTCRHWILTPYGWNMVMCLSCENLFKRDKLPFDRKKSDYRWIDKYQCWEYESPELRKSI